MSSFDFSSGMQGAQTGATLGGPFAPYTAAAGFVIGGFVGGHKKSAAKKKLKKKQKRYWKAYQELTGWIGQNGFEPTGTSIEYYLNDPMETPPDELKTLIVFPLK